MGVTAIDDADHTDRNEPDGTGRTNDANRAGR
jgi:hypothetical protein